MVSWITFIILLVFCIVSSMVIGLVVPDQGLEVEEQSKKVKKKQRKSDFPEFDGKDARDVLIEMQAKYPRYTPEIVPEGSAVTMDYQRWRVRIYVKKNKKVIGSFIG